MLSQASSQAGSTVPVVVDADEEEATAQPPPLVDQRRDGDAAQVVEDVLRWRESPLLGVAEYCEQNRPWQVWAKRGGCRCDAFTAAALRGRMALGASGVLLSLRGILGVA